MIMKNIQLDDRGRFTYTFDSEVERFTFFIMNTSGDYLDENVPEKHRGNKVHH